MFKSYIQSQMGSKKRVRASQTIKAFYNHLLKGGLKE